MKKFLELVLIALCTFAGVRAIAHDDGKPSTCCSSSTPAASPSLARSVADGR